MFTLLILIQYKGRRCWIMRGWIQNGHKCWNPCKPIAAMEQREQGWVSRSRAANGEFCLQGGSGQSCCPEGGAEKREWPPGYGDPLQPYGGAEGGSFASSKYSVSALCQGCATGTSNLFKTSAVHMKHVWWCGFVSSLGKVSLFIKKTEKKAEVH